MSFLWVLHRKLVFIFLLLAVCLGWHTLVEASSIRLTWTDTSNNEDGFKVEHLVAGAFVEKITTVSPNTTSYTDSGLVTGNIYCYRVRAFNGGGDSEPSNQACAIAQNPTVSVDAALSVSPTTVRAGGTVTATWSGISAPTSKDWISLHVPGAADQNSIDWIYVSCSKAPGSAKASGSCSFVIPSTVSPGSYELRLFANDGYTRLTTSNGFTVTAARSTSATLSVSPPTVRAGGTVTATWSGISAPTSKDWISLHVPGAADQNSIDWIYVSCSKAPGSALASGSCSYVLPATLSLGNYELRLFANDGYARLTISNGFTVTAGGSTSTTLSVSPTTLTAGGTVNATWSGITAPAPKDWIGLYVPGAADTKFIDWIYVSCSKTPGSAKASGSCPFVIPSTLSSGSYELRLFANDGYARLARSGAFAVSGGVPSPVPTSQVASWTDYRLTLKLQSMDDDSIGVIFRYQNNNNYYRFVWNRQSKFRRLEKVENGVRTVLARDSVQYTIGRIYQLEIVAQGATLRVLIDGAQIFSVTDSSFAEGTIGLRSVSNQGSSFDDILVEDLATGAVLLSNDFNDGALTGWTVVDQGTNQGPSAWSAQTGALVQDSNIDGTFAIYTARSWTDYSFTVKMQSMDNDSIGAMFRYQDNDNFYRFSWYNELGFRALEKVENGVPTVLAEDTVPYVTGQAYQLEITARGSTIEVRIDSNLIFSVTDSSFDMGTVGLYSCWNQGSSFDDVVVEDLATGAVLLSEDFNDGTLTGWTIVDQGTEQGPSVWSAETGALVQSSNIGSNSNYLGTFALYTK